MVVAAADEATPPEAVRLEVAEREAEEDGVADEGVDCLGLLGCICGVYEPAAVAAAAGGVPGGAAVAGMEEVRDTTGRDGGSGMVEEKEAELRLP